MLELMAPMRIPICSIRSKVQVTSVSINIFHIDESKLDDKPITLKKNSNERSSFNKFLAVFNSQFDASM